MAIDSFYFSIELSSDERKLMKNRIHYIENKQGELIYNKAILISETIGWWHISIGFCNFFDNCEILYELCLVINEIKPQFEFTILNEKTLFNFKFMNFLEYIYDLVKKYKENFNTNYGKMLVVPGNDFYKFRRKNKKLFIIETNEKEPT